MTTLDTLPNIRTLPRVRWTTPRGRATRNRKRFGWIRSIQLHQHYRGLLEHGAPIGWRERTPWLGPERYQP